jgi:hypothetical protein
MLMVIVGVNGVLDSTDCVSKTKIPSNEHTINPITIPI